MRHMLAMTSYLVALIQLFAAFALHFVTQLQSWFSVESDAAREP